MPKVCRKCAEEKPLSEFYSCGSQQKHSYCSRCLRLVNELNRVIREGVTEVDITWPYLPEEKLVYAVAHPDDPSALTFKGNPKCPGIPEVSFTCNKEPKDQSSEYFLENILDEDHTIYFAYDPRKALIKIGRTAEDVEQRLRQSDLAHTYLLATIPNQNRTLENKLHQRFSEHRVEGEWFRLSAEILAYIDDLVLDSGVTLHMERCVA